MTTGFQTPQDAEDAFYDAFEGHDLEAMMATWDDAQDVICVQPMGPILQGRLAVQDSWQAIFGHKEKPDVEIHHRHWFESAGLAVHVVEERVTVMGMPANQPPLIAANVYRRTESGWRLVCHQVSPPPPIMPPGAPF